MCRRSPGQVIPRQLDQMRHLRRGWGLAGSARTAIDVGPDLPLAWSEDSAVSKTNGARSASRQMAMRSNAIFSDLAAETVDQLCRRASFLTFDRGDYVFRRGDPGTYLFGVVTGAV